MNLIDGHCHLANLAQLMPLEPLLEEARQQGIIRFLSSALSKSELRFHSAHPHASILFSAGIHPNFPECDLELEDVRKLCSSGQIWAVGEIGLDRNNPDLQQQLNIFTTQLELAATHKLPVVLHIVGHQQLAYETLKRYPLKYLVHGYAGSFEGFQLLSRLDSVFTISERLLKPDKLNLLRGIVDSGSFLLETDITRYYVHQGEPNPLLRLLGLSIRVQELCDLEGTRLESCQNQAFRHLLGVQP